MIKFGQIFSRFKTLFQIPQYQFSDYFEARDKSELILHWEKKTYDPRYLSLKNKWQEDLKRKQARRLRQEQLDASRSKTEPQESKFVVHNPREGIQLPIDPNAVFAVVEIAGRQFKVTKDDLVMAEYIADLGINQTIELSNVIMVGTKEYSSLGRPYVTSAKVIATVEQQTLTEKLIILKKQRRKRFRKSQGHRQSVTVLRINEIIHDIKNEELSRAVSLI